MTLDVWLTCVSVCYTDFYVWYTCMSGLPVCLSVTPMSVSVSGCLHVIDFRRYLEMDISLPSDAVHKFADQLSTHLQCSVSEVRRLFLVEDMVDTLKVCQLVTSV